MASEILAAVKQPYSNFNPLPPSSEALEHRVYSPEEELLITELIPLANTIATDPEIASAFGIMKWEEMGDSDRSRRFSGKHPLPERKINGEEYVYSVPVVAGILPLKDKRNGAVRYSAISVMKDNWREDPDAWRVTWLDLQTGETSRIDVFGVTIDAKRRANIVLKPDNYDNIPPLSRPGIGRVPMCDLERITARLDEDYHAWQAQYSDGLRQSGQIIDIDLLNEAMVRAMGVRIDEEVFGDYTGQQTEEDSKPVASPAITAAQYIVSATVNEPALSGTA